MHKETVEQMLDNCSWSEFRIGELFEKISVKKLKYKAGDLPKAPTASHTLPALTAGILNQGLNNYVPYEGATVLENKITISANGANSGATFYQKGKFTVLQDAYAIDFIYYEKELNDFQKLFFTTAISVRLRGIYNWVNKAGWDNVKNNLIRLPITPEGKIDFDFMETFIGEIQKMQIEDIVKHIDDKMTAIKMVCGD